jgi:hypothetical protein
MPDLNTTARGPRRPRHPADDPVFRQPPRTLLDLADRLLDRMSFRRWSWSQTMQLVVLLVVVLLGAGVGVWLLHGTAGWIAGVGGTSAGIGYAARLWTRHHTAGPRR